MTESTVKDVDNLEGRNGVLIAEKECLKQENDTLKVTNALLCAQIQVLGRAVITPKSLMDDDSKVKYYTGLPSFNVLKATFDFVSPCVGTYSRMALPLFDQFLLVLGYGSTWRFSTFHITSEFIHPTFPGLSLSGSM